jgi:carbon monoxide dehydrogenase subunit G
MKTTINKIFQVDHPIDIVWDYLADPTKIVTCVPGASLTEKIDDRNFKGKVSLKFGPVKAAYDGKITIEELDVANRKMVLKGAGVDPKGKGSADMEMIGILTEKDGGTEVNYNMEVSLIGMLAQFGSRLVNDVSDQLLNQFVDNFKSKLDAEVTAAAPPPMPDAAAATAVVEEVKEAAAEAGEQISKAAEQIKTAAKPPTAQEDNSLNAFALMWAVIKGFFSRLFGGGK